MRSSRCLGLLCGTESMASDVLNALVAMTGQARAQLRGWGLHTKNPRFCVPGIAGHAAPGLAGVLAPKRL
jgi:hypothetical protein